MCWVIIILIDQILSPLILDKNLSVLCDSIGIFFLNLLRVGMWY